jgi:hypothetical protein
MAAWLFIVALPFVCLCAPFVVELIFPPTTTSEDGDD